MKNDGYNSLWNYCDDLIYFGLLSTIENSYNFFINLQQELGLNASTGKIIPPST